MATTKTKDLAVKVGEYTDSNGNTKNRYKNIGAIYEKDDGGTYLALDSTIVTMELQYIANPKRSERILVSMFDSNSQGSAPRQPRAERPAPADKPAKATSAADLDDDIPF